MSFVNFATREVVFKVAYCGPTGGGRGTSLRYIQGQSDPATRGKLFAFATETEQQTFLDFLPRNLGIRGFQVRLLLWSVTPTVSERRCPHLQGADGVVFVADSLAARREANRVALEQLAVDLGRCGLDLARVPGVLQSNKRDLPEILSLEEMDGELRAADWPRFASVATTGAGVFDALKGCVRLVMAEHARRPVARGAPG